MKAGTVTPDSILKLGDFEFHGFEVPTSLPFGGSQALVTHRLPGGKKVVQSMGAESRPIAWSGRFRGANAMARARYLDELRYAGRPLSLMWLDFSYTVKIASFSPDYERMYEVPYSITVEVIEDLSKRPEKAPALGYTDLIYNDAADASSQADAIGDGPLSSLMSTLNSSIRAVSDFAKATTTQINSVLGPLADAKARVDVLIASTGNTVRNVTTLGGILPNNPIAKNAAALTAQVTAMTQAPQLYNLQSTLARIGGNIGQINPATSGQSVTMAGGSLYKLAADSYGDASKWDVIASANGLNDPEIQGIQQITVPNA